MKITVLGAGNMGSAFVQQLTRAGHQVSVTARDGAKAAAVAEVLETIQVEEAPLVDVKV